MSNQAASVLELLAGLIVSDCFLEYMNGIGLDLLASVRAFELLKKRLIKHFGAEVGVLRIRNGFSWRRACLGIGTW